jgi:hydroxyacylglutathione hydrolase
MLNSETIEVTPFPQNSRILWCSETKECVVVDPGGEAAKIADRVKALNLTCTAIWLTHSHLDHCGGVAPLLEHFNVKLFAHPAESDFRASVLTVARMYGLPSDEWHNCPEPTDLISGGEVLSVGECRAEVRFTPGHSPGSVSFYFPDDKVIVSGDVLFAGSIGRTDLPRGDHSQLIASIKREIFTLDDSVKVLSGHGEDTTVGQERRHNPFLA